MRRRSYMKGSNRDDERRRTSKILTSTPTDVGEPGHLTQAERNLLRKVYDPFDHRNLVVKKAMRKAKHHAPRPTPSSKRDSFGMLDSCYASSALSLLKMCGSWRFNIFALDRLTSGRPIYYLGMFIFHRHNIFSLFKLDAVKFSRTLHMIEDMYHCRNPYHNAMHAADVAQAMYCYLLEEKLKSVLSPFDFFFSVMAAICHDLDHPGVNQSYLEKTKNYLSSLYENSSVLEKHHWRAAVSVFHETRVFSHFTNNQWNYFRECFAKLILATDISQQQTYLMKFSALVGSKTMNASMNTDHKTLLLQMALKCADICNPCREWSICCSWANLVTEEFFRQGDRERRQCLPSIPMMDRYNTTKPKVQTGFINFLVKPLFNDWHAYMRSPLSSEMRETIEKNLSRWEALEQKDKENKHSSPHDSHNSNNNNNSNSSGSPNSGAGNEVLLSFATQAPASLLEPLQEEAESPVAQMKSMMVCETADRRHSLPGNLLPAGSSLKSGSGVTTRLARRRGSMPKAYGHSQRLPIVDQVTLDVSADASDSPSSVDSLSPPTQAGGSAGLRDLSNVHRAALTRQLLAQPPPPLEVLMRRRGSAPVPGSMAMASMLLRTVAISASSAGTAPPLMERRRSQSVDLEEVPLPRHHSLVGQPALSAGSLAHLGSSSVTLDMLMGSMMSCGQENTLSVQSLSSAQSTSPLVGESSP